LFWSKDLQKLPGFSLGAVHVCCIRPKLPFSVSVSWFQEALEMKKLSMLLVCSFAMLLLSGNVMAQEQVKAHPEGEVAPHPEPGAEVELFCHVKYKDLDEMAPCASPKIIAVKDPCACDDCCCCTPACVYIKICVPCGCEVVTCSKNGDRIRYDYGKYAVDVRVKKGYIEVDYQD